ncbi:hypothetical protein ACSSS7_004875 [Eimeria intestinalis]
MTAESAPPPSSGGPAEEPEGPPDDPSLPVSADDLQLALSAQNCTRWWGAPPQTPSPCWGAPLLLPEEEASASIADPEVTRAWVQWTDSLTTPTLAGYKNLLNNLGSAHARLQDKNKKVGP